MSAGKVSGIALAMTRVGNCNDQPVGNQIWTIPTLFTYPGETRTSEVYKIGVDNPAYFDSECQSADRDSAVATVVTTPAKLKKQPWLRLWKLSFIKSEKVRQRRTLALMVIFVVILIVLVVAVGLAIYLSMRDMGWSWPTQEERSTEIEENWAVAGNFRITNRVYTPDLANPTSPQYIRLVAEILQSLDDMFLQSPLVRDYNTSEIVRFSEGSVVVDCHIFLNRPIDNIAQKIGLIFVRNLEMGHGTLPAGTLNVDIQTIQFVGIRGVIPTVTPPTPISDAAWSQWSEWSSCMDLQGRCDPKNVQSRSRECRTMNGRGTRLMNNIPCQESGKSRKLEIKECFCEIADSTTVITTTTTTTERQSQPTTKPLLQIRQPCSVCPDGEVCLLAIGASEAYCVKTKDPTDPRGCGGWCSGIHELCRQLNKTVFQCIDDSECLEGEWKCANGLCVPSKRRCDGHFNCYDMTDEYDCECGADQFHCGNKTSCLPVSMRCNGYIDCWDGSDEINCTVSCPDGQYTCNDGQCIPNKYFCDRFVDCVDKSDEPEGCDASCTIRQHQCDNGRCINTVNYCDGVDDCGDGSDEENCKTSGTTVASGVSDEHSLSANNRTKNNVLLKT
ncbi:uncharacterized protein LOC111638618 isoform X2 [Centruroides sculpturatus]|uniref:uncharacterized protein LOC111638618 isoform X2 n=1 Tax=Centruroides sculpturatus TaxID=218467 RepID=UPI000C6D56C2|nr:uncharacterized protein LOC111638618 isoform X2 [Centruroides sculpturatus]